MAMKRLQLELAFPFDGDYPSKPRPRPAPSNWHTQPRKFPPDYWRKSRDNPNWRYEHEQAWIKRRKADGLPHVIHNPTSNLYATKKPVRRENIDISGRRVGTTAGAAVPGPLSNPRRLTA